MTTKSVLAELRKKRGLSQGNLATKSGVPQASINRFERERRTITADAAKKLSKALGVNVAALMISHNVAALKAQIANDEPGAVRRAVSLAGVLVEALEETGSVKEAERIESALGELVKSVQAGHLPPHLDPDEDGHEDQMLALGRDGLGRRISDDEVQSRQREERGARGRPSVAVKSFEEGASDMHALDRDPWGRRL